MHTEPKFTFWDGYLADWQNTIEALTLPVPDGFTFPALPPGDPEAKVLYAEGCGEVAVMLTWLAAAESAALEAHRQGDAVLETRWLKALAKWPETSTFLAYNDPDVPVSWREHVLDPAFTGDFSAMEEHAASARYASSEAD